MRYRQHVFVCVNERDASDSRGCCAAKGAGNLRGYLKRRAAELGLTGLRMNKAGCLDACADGPVLVIYPEGVWYRCVTKEDADEILLTHIRDGGRVARLMLDRESGDG